MTTLFVVMGVSLLALVMAISLPIALDGKALRLTDAVLLSGAEETPVKLPTTWFGKNIRKSFRLHFEMPSSPEEPQVVFVPFYDGRIVAMLDGHPLPNASPIILRVNPLRHTTAIFVIPDAHAGPGKHSLTLTLDNPLGVLGSLSDIRIAPEGEALHQQAMIDFANRDLHVLLVGAHAFVCLISLVLFLLRPAERLFLWLFWTMAGASLFSMGALGDTFPILAGFFPYLICFAPLGGFFLLGFTLELLSPGDSARLRPRVAIPALLLLGIVQAFSPLVFELAAGVSVPLLLMTGCTSVVLMWRAKDRHERKEIQIVLAATVTVMLAVVHDLSMRLGAVPSGLFLAPFARLFFLTAIAYLMMKRQADYAAALDQSARTLASKLAEREADLHRVFKAQQVFAERELLNQERQRMTSDLHDGVAGHLVTIVTLAEHMAPSDNRLVNTARTALIDLRLVIDALSTDDADLLYTLASFRDRCIAPLETLGLEVEWSMVGLPSELNLTPRDTLHVLRILQEAVNNAVRHGHPSKLTICGDTQENGRPRIVVRNVGGTSPQMGPRGRGLSNMAKRADALTARFTFRPLPDGAEAELSF
ncbi:sensor histidine kinase [Kordiimonas marina]|uniref:sensor histidine kinase n=1 Tax=Kordiimonas marina TaxID=2872312 RepID=UPI001FF1AD9D|nr:hypothetical protein [Kordiimonas marina]MCJ9429304.1 hypothetical protein [Kordiimonas marina]